MIFAGARALCGPTRRVDDAIAVDFYTALMRSIAAGQGVLNAFLDATRVVDAEFPAARQSASMLIARTGYRGSRASWRLEGVTQAQRAAARPLAAYPPTFPRWVHHPRPTHASLTAPPCQRPVTDGLATRAGRHHPVVADVRCQNPHCPAPPAARPHPPDRKSCRDGPPLKEILNVEAIDTIV